MYFHELNHKFINLKANFKVKVKVKVKMKVPVTPELREKRYDTEENCFNPDYTSDKVDPYSAADSGITDWKLNCDKPERFDYLINYLTVMIWI